MSHPHRVLTRWDPEAVHHRLHQPQYVKGTATHIGQEKHDPDASPELRAQGTADHIFLKSRKAPKTPNQLPSGTAGRPTTHAARCHGAATRNLPTG